MSFKQYDLVIIGGGSAGMAAALSAWQEGVKNILVLERDIELGGILNQCIHNGFGIHHFKEELTGPEYAARVVKELRETGVDVWLDTMVLKIDPDKVVHAVSTSCGYTKIAAKAIVLAMGCRERTRGQIQLQGSRPAGVFTAGTVQRLMNMEGVLPGKEVVILGSGDIGLIMARRMALQGAKVKMVIEIMPHSNGCARNIAQCLDDFDIPLLLSHTVTEVHGDKRVTGVTIAKVDRAWQTIAGSEELIHCDTLLLAVGLIPENEITRKAGIAIDKFTRGPVVGEMRQTSMPGIFACGNVLQVHDIVDFVSKEGEIAGKGAAHYLQGKLDISCKQHVKAGDGISYVVPQHICWPNVPDVVELYMRVRNVSCKTEIQVLCGEEVIARKKTLKFFPAEMVSVGLKLEQLKKCDGRDLEVRLVGMN